MFKISPKGEVETDGSRSEPRFCYGGTVHVEVPGAKPFRATARDLSQHGIGIRVEGKLKSYRIGSRLNLEFAYPHELSGLVIEVELVRVLTTFDNFDDCGFRIVSKNRMLIERLRKLLRAIEDPYLF